MPPALRIPVDLDLAQFTSGMSDLHDKVHDESEHIQGHFEDINGAITQVTLGVGAFGVAIGAATLSAVNSLAKIGDLGDDLRLPVNLLQSISVAADEARVPADLLTAAFKKFSDVSKDGSTKTKDFETALSNVDQKFLDAFKSAGTQQERLGIVSNALKSTTDEVKRAQIALEFFGTDNERLIAVLGVGAAGFDRYVENAAKLGLSINENLVKQAQEAQSQLNLLTRVLTDQFSVAAANLIPILTKMLPAFQAIALAAQAASAVFATDDTASIKTLSTELDGLVDQWARVKTQRDALADGQVSKSDQFAESVRDGIKAFTGGAVDLTQDASASIKVLDGDLAKIQDRIETVKKLIASKSAAPSTAQPAFAPRPELNPDKDAFDKQVDSIKKHIAALEADGAAVGKTVAQHDQLRAELALLNAAEKESDDITTEQVDKYTQLRATMSAQQALTGAGITLNTEHAASFAAISQRMLDVSQHTQDLSRGFKAVNDAIQFSGEQGISILDGLRNHTLTASSAVLQLANAFITAAEKALLLGSGPLAGLFGTQSSVAGGTGGLLGLLAGIAKPGAQPSVGSAVLPDGFKGWFANGGVLGDGQWGMAGENGPEPVIGPAQIVPNPVTSRSSSAAQPIIIHQTFNNEFSSGINGTDRAQISNEIAQSANQARIAAVSDVKSLGIRRAG